MVTIASPNSNNVTPRAFEHLLQFDGVTLHLVVERRPLYPQHLGCFLLVSVTLSERLNDRIALHVVQVLDAATVDPFNWLKRSWQLHFRWNFFYADPVLASEHDRIFDRVLKLANVAGPGIIEQLLKCLGRNF